MKLLATLKSTVLLLGGLLFMLAFGARPAAAQSDVALSIEDTEAQAGSAVDVPIQAENFDNVGSLRLVINYDDQAISFPSNASTSDLISGAPRSNFTANVTEPGRLVISWFDGTGSNPINLGTGTLLNLTFSNFSGGTANVSFASESEVTDAQSNVIGATFQDGVVAENIGNITVGSKSDVGLNQSVNVPLSGQDLSNVGSVSLKVSFDTTAIRFEQIANDNSGLSLNASAKDGVVTIGGFNSSGTSLGSNFVELQFKFLGGSSNLQVISGSEVTDPQSNTLPVEFTDGSVDGDDPTVSLPDRAAASGETITVPLQTTDLQAMGSASIDVSYNAGALTFTGSANGIQGFNLNVQKQQDGLIRVAGFSSSGVDPANNGGRIVDLQFTVDQQPSGSETQLTFDAASEVTNPSSTPYNMVFNGGRVVVEQTKIGLSAQSLTYDVTTVDSTSSETLTITNTSSSVASLSGSVSLESDTFSVASGSGNFALDPGQTRTVTIDYTPTEVANPDRDTLKITHNADNAASPLEVPLEGSAELLSISEARGQGVGATVAVEGTVTRAFGSYVRIQDGSGATGASGLVIRQTDDSSFQGDIGASITKGTQLRVTGTLSAFNGLLQINNQDLASYAVQGQGSAPSAQDVELQTLSASGEDYESELVTVDSVRFVNPDTTGGTLDERTTYRIEGPGGVTFQYRVQSAAQTDVIGAPINPGMFTYTGVVGEFQGTYQFIPIRTSTGLPVELTSFEGTSVKRDGESAVQLTWRTTSETNNAGFRVQRKQVGAESGWKTIGRREGAGTTSEAQTYRFTDGNLPYAADTLTYRLRQVDVDGTSHFSDPVKIARSGPEGIELLGTAPNPARSRAVVRFAVPEGTGGEARLALYDVMGRKVRSMRVSAKAGRHKKSIDVSGLASGMYILRLSVKDAAPKTQKVTVVR